MAIFQCPQCRTSLRAPEDKSAVQVKCPKCNCLIQVPDPNRGAVCRDVASVIPSDEKAVQRMPPEKHCIECGARIRAKAVVCPECGVSQTDSSPRNKKHCYECGAIIRGRASICPKCGVEQARGGSTAPNTEGSPEDIKAAGDKKIAAGLCGIFLGAFGIHKFVLGFTTPAVIMLVLSLVGSCFYLMGPLIMGTIGFVEGIIYLTKSDEDFYQNYIVGKKGWF